MEDSDRIRATPVPEGGATDPRPVVAVPVTKPVSHCPQLRMAECRSRFGCLGDWFSTRPTIGNVFFRKMLPDAFPLLVREPNHPTFIADRLRETILR